MYTFNVRVYGVLLDVTKTAILVSDEKHHNRHITKFVGGGLEFGEGTMEALKREFKEELDIEVDVLEHFYTTDFFVSSAFNDDSQVISIYYWVTSNELDKVKADGLQDKVEELVNGGQLLRWLPISKINQTEFTFPIDKKVATLLQQYFQS
jgi:8-oxo-dGTP diphosphatase